MPKVFPAAVLLILLIIIGLVAAPRLFQNNSIPIMVTNSENVLSGSQSDQQPEIFAENLEVPWAIEFLDDQTIVITERPGRLKILYGNNSAELLASIDIKEVRQIGEGGLLGVVKHPNFPQNSLIYLYYTDRAEGNNTYNRVVRYKLADNILSESKIIVDQIPGASNHNGGRLKFGPDGYLYITTGDAQDPSSAQDRSSLAGKILRVTDEGNSAPGNPFSNFIYSYGHRNPQGLAWDSQHRLWATEHGPSAHDELNLIEAGKNYGWPVIQGTQSYEGMEKPAAESGTGTWAPSGLAYANDKLYFGGLRGQALYAVDINQPDLKITALSQDQFGRIREVITTPDGGLLVTTSNRDGRGAINPGDDRIIKVL